LKKIVIILIAGLFIGCQNSTELAMERGIQFYEWDRIEESILEFKYVIHILESQKKNLKYEKLKLLSRAHHNLAVAYAKKKWYEDAVEEARKAFEYFPTDDNRKVLELIQIKESKNIMSKPTKIDSTNQ